MTLYFARLEINWNHLLYDQIKPTYLLGIKVNSYLNTKFLEQMAVPMDS